MARTRRSRPAVRLVALLSTFGFLLVALSARLVQLQVVQAAPLELLGANQRIRTIELPALRGSILDRNGVELARSARAFAIYANPRHVPDPETAAATLAPILGVTPASLAVKLRRDASFVYLDRAVTPAVAATLTALKLPYIGMHATTARVYPDGRVAGQVLGFVGIDQDGLSGLEAQFDELLRGKPGREVIEQDPNGRPIPQGQNSLRRPTKGEGLALTLDEAIQYQAEEALARGVAATHARDGVALVMDARTGEVLAMANVPRFDPNNFGVSKVETQRNRIVTDAYEPGSVNKVMTAAAAIEAGIMTPESVIKVPSKIHVADKWFRDAEAHGLERMTYADAIARSSNIATIEVALKLGARKMYETVRRFGLGARTDVGFIGEGQGILPPLARWSGTSIATIPIGQGIAATPLQIAQVYQTIANDGIRVQPSIVRGTVRGDGTFVRAARPKRTRVVSTYTAAQVRAMLIGVVEHGTGERAAIPGYLVAGKTGTARVPRVGSIGYSNQIITTFTGMAPADDPRLVVLVALNDPTPAWAALTAAPVFREIMQFSLSHLGVPPTVTLNGGKKAARP